MRPYVVAAFVFALLNAGAPALAAPTVDQGAGVDKSDALPAPISIALESIQENQSTPTSTAVPGTPTPPNPPNPPVRRDDILSALDESSTSDSATATETTIEYESTTDGSGTLAVIKLQQATPTSPPVKRQEATGSASGNLNVGVNVHAPTSTAATESTATHSTSTGEITVLPGVMVSIN